MLDSSKITTVTQRLLEMVEENHGDDCTIGEISVVAEVIEDDNSIIYVRCSSQSPTVRVGLLTRALNAEA